MKSSGAGGFLRAGRMLEFTHFLGEEVRRTCMDKG
jgi:hypothetical protein